MSEEDSVPEPLPSAQPNITVDIKDLHLPEKYKTFFQMVLDYVEDQDGFYTGNTVTKRNLTNYLTRMRENQIIGLSEIDDMTTKMKEKGAKWDGIVHSFIEGAGGRMSPWGEVENSMAPVALRSIAKRKIMQTCHEQGRDYYYIDTGYFGNGKFKTYHRVTKNAMQWLGPTEDRPTDRLDRCGIKVSKMRKGSKILLCPPSEKAMKYWNLDLNEWMDSTISTIKEHTDREIVVRLKQPRSVRVNTDTMEMALNDDVHCLVTFNSIAAIEGLIYGKPVFTMGPNAAQPLSNTDLSNLENPFKPDQDQVRKLLACLAYHQFTVEEMRTGYAWAVLNGEA